MFDPTVFVVFVRTALQRNSLSLWSDAACETDVFLLQESVARMFVLFKELVKQDIFPRDWFVMITVTCK